MKNIIMKYQKYAARPRVVYKELCLLPEKVTCKTIGGPVETVKGSECKWYYSLVRYIEISSTV